MKNKANGGQIKKIRLPVNLTPQQESRIVLLYERGYLMSEIAFKFGLSASETRQLIKRISPETLKETRCFNKKRDYIDDGQLKNIVRLYQEGFSVETIALRYKIDTSTVSNIVNRLKPGVVSCSHERPSFPPESESVELAKKILRKKICPVFCIGRVLVGEPLDKYRVGNKIVDRKTLLEMAHDCN